MYANTDHKNDFFKAEDAAWEAEKKEAKYILSERARARRTISYSELIDEISSVNFEAYDLQFFKFLGEISSEENKEGRGMLTVLVVHKNGDMQPGLGFFELAKYLGRDTSDVLQCWISELNKVFSVWSKESS